MSMFDICKP